jgi:hypothetical protein
MTKTDITERYNILKKLDQDYPDLSLWLRCNTYKLDVPYLRYTWFSECPYAEVKDIIPNDAPEYITKILEVDSWSFLY